MRSDTKMIAVEELVGGLISQSESNLSWQSTQMMHADLDSLLQLPLAEKLRVVEVLWEDIAASPDLEVFERSAVVRDSTRL
jgi:hypothetical protein